MEATRILGQADEPRFAGLTVEHVSIAWGDARKHQRIVTTSAGRELRIRLPRGTFLAEGSVLWADDETAVVVQRPAEDAIVVEFADNTGPDAVRRALLLGYLLGNQHAPLDVTAQRLATPMMTGPETARRTLRDLGLVGDVRPVPLARHGWSNTSADHHHEHAEAHARAHDQARHHDHGRGNDGHEGGHGDHDHSHSDGDNYGHGNGHERGQDHGHRHGTGHGHDHGTAHGHGHGHAHGHGHEHGAAHSREPIHAHSGAGDVHD
ncbi:urease accessory protein UreE [Nocardia higoensis]|uniref:urease accessory protein UreE n=1 Tax=Nocardia higoensis TaxID=228599 RepID=UPI000318ADF4|nr:urease accessory protein UreE [Nocardia higoensis]